MSAADLYPDDGPTSSSVLSSTAMRTEPPSEPAPDPTMELEPVRALPSNKPDLVYASDAVLPRMMLMIQPTLFKPEKFDEYHASFVAAVDKELETVWKTGLRVVSSDGAFPQPFGNVDWRNPGEDLYRVLIAYWLRLFALQFNAVDTKLDRFEDKGVENLKAAWSYFRRRIYVIFQRLGDATTVWVEQMLKQDETARRLYSMFGAIGQSEATSGDIVELKALRRDNNQLRREITAFMGGPDANATIETIREQLDRLAREREELQTELVRIIIDAMLPPHTQLPRPAPTQDELFDLQLKIKELETLTAALQKRLLDQSLQLAEAKRCEDLELQLAIARRDLAAARKELEQFGADYTFDALVGAALPSKAFFVALDTIAGLRKELIKLQREFDSLANTVEGAAAETEDSTAVIRALEKQVNELTAQTADLQRQYDECIATSIAKAEELSDVRKKAKRDEKRAKKDRDAEKAAWDAEMVALRAEHDSEMAALRAELAECQEGRERATQMIVNTDMSLLEARIDELATANQQLADKAIEDAETIADLRVRLAKSESLYNESVAEFDAKERDLLERIRAERRLHDLESERVNEALVQVEALTQQATLDQERIAELENTNRIVTAGFNKLKTTNQTATERIQFLEEARNVAAATLAASEAAAAESHRNVELLISSFPALPLRALIEWGPLSSAQLPVRVEEPEFEL